MAKKQMKLKARTGKVHRGTGRTEPVPVKARVARKGR